MLIKDLTMKHPEWSAHAPFWSRINDLFVGGFQIQAKAAQFLHRRPSEHESVFDSRCKRFGYQNIISQCMGWYISRLFRDQPSITIQDAAGTVVEDPGISKFLGNCDRRNTPISAMASSWWTRAALDGRVHVLLDLPVPRLSSPRTLAEQRAAGDLDPYLVTYPAASAINWAMDENGELTWIVFEVCSEAAAALGAKRTTVTRWYYYDRETYVIFEGDAGKPDASASVLREGRHALADQVRVPVFTFRLPSELWLGNRAYLPTLEHLNEDNGLGWKLLMSNLAVPVIAGDEFDDRQPVSETQWIKLTKGSTFSWSEPAGANFVHSANRTEALKYEIFRQFYLQAHGRSPSATPAAQSGYSKEMDMEPASDALNGFGAALRTFLSEVVSAASSVIATKRDLTAVVTGLAFADESIADIADAQLSAEFVASRTWTNHVRRKIVTAKTPDVTPQERDAIFKEIDLAPEAQGATFSARISGGA